MGHTRRPANRRRGVVITALAALTLAAAACADEGSEDSEADRDAEPAVVGSAGCRDGGGGDGAHELSHEGIAREYVVHLPDRYEPETPARLVFNLHGLGSNIEQQDAYSYLADVAGPRGYIVVTPQGEDLRASGFEGRPFWNTFTEVPDDENGTVGATTDGDPVPRSSPALGADDIGFFAALTDHLLDEYCIDTDRVFSTGMSNGAGMSTVLGCELDGRIRAIGPVAGVNIPSVCLGDAPVSVLAIHGDADEVVHYDGNHLIGLELGNPSVPDRMAQWAEHNGCGPEPVVDAQEEGVVVTRWRDCVDEVEVELWTLEGWGHQWPRGGDATGPGSVEATPLILDFFDRVHG